MYLYGIIAPIISPSCFWFSFDIYFEHETKLKQKTTYKLKPLLLNSHPFSLHLLYNLHATSFYRIHHHSNDIIVVVNKNNNNSNTSKTNKIRTMQNKHIKSDQTRKQTNVQLVATLWSPFFNLIPASQNHGGFTVLWLDIVLTCYPTEWNAKSFPVFVDFWVIFSC